MGREEEQRRVRCYQDMQQTETSERSERRRKSSVIPEAEENDDVSMEEEHSTNSVSSFSSASDFAEDASSPSSASYGSYWSTSSSSHGPLYELSELMANLPIKRGLSKYYNGKSESFTSLASVKSLEDLAKKGHYGKLKKKMKTCRSYGGGLIKGIDELKKKKKNMYSPKVTLSKKPVRSSSFLVFPI